MFGIGTGELLLLLLVALVVLGPERMPRLARDVGRALAEFRKTSDELREEFLNADKLAERMTQATVPGASALPEAGSADAGPAGPTALAETSAAASAIEQDPPMPSVESSPVESSPVESSPVTFAEGPTAAPPEAEPTPANAAMEPAMAAADAAAAVPAASSAAPVARSTDAAAPEGPVSEPSLEARSPATDEAVTDHGETAFDREAREARERLQGPEHRALAEAEGWEKPTDAAGNSSEKWA